MLTWFFMNNFTRCDKGKNLNKAYPNNCSHQIQILAFCIIYESKYSFSELKQKEIEEEAQRILTKYKGNYTALYNLIKYDNANCSLQGRRKSFRKLIPCSIPEVLKGLSGVCGNFQF